MKTVKGVCKVQQATEARTKKPLALDSTTRPTDL